MWVRFTSTLLVITPPHPSPTLHNCPTPIPHSSLPSLAPLEGSSALDQLIGVEFGLESSASVSGPWALQVIIFACRRSRRRNQRLLSRWKAPEDASAPAELIWAVAISGRSPNARKQKGPSSPSGLVGASDECSS